MRYFTILVGVVIDQTMGYTVVSMEVKMKFIAQKKDIFDAANSVATVVPRSPSIQLLGNILIEATDTGLKLTGSDMETWVAQSISAQVSTQGETTVPSKIFTDLISNLPGDEVQIDMSDGAQMVITSSKAKVTLNCADSTDYPRIPKLVSGDSIAIEKDALLSLVDRVTPALSERMEDKRELLGALVSMKEGKFHLVGTDGQRLALCEYPVPNTPDVEAIVSGNVWRNLSKLVGDDDSNEVKLNISQTQAGFHFGNVEVVSRLIEGEYPPYRQVVPVKFEHKVVVDTKNLLSALSRVNIIVRQSSRKVTILARDGELICKGIAPEVGEVEEKLEASTDGADMELSFDIKKLMDGIKGVYGPSTAINLNGPLHPVLIQADGDDSYKYILVTYR